MKSTAVLLWKEIRSMWGILFVIVAYQIIASLSLIWLDSSRFIDIQQGDLEWYIGLLFVMILNSSFFLFPVYLLYSLFMERRDNTVYLLYSLPIRRIYLPAAKCIVVLTAMIFVTSILVLFMLYFIRIDLIQNNVISILYGLVKGFGSPVVALFIACMAWSVSRAVSRYRFAAGMAAGIGGFVLFRITIQIISRCAFENPLYIQTILCLYAITFLFSFLFLAAAFFLYWKYADI